ncbi:hypothetical protein GCM10008110_03220 [Marinobacter persicus]|nr:hypothetical protein GCM10008110_03220 [Marinobacter persicus]
MNSTQAWVSYLSKVELPVLANTLRRINELTESQNSTVNELANVILNDAQLTSQVLRLSNTVFYNRSATQVSTVSRAIHAAVQARCLLPSTKEQALEEVFIGALLMNIGELAFWSCETDQATELEERLRLEEPPIEAQRAVLHTTFLEITRGLVGTLTAKGRLVGLFYADNAAAGYVPSKQQEEAFAHFIQNAQLCLALMSAR